MKQSFVKMMNRLAEMENCILKGLVLDEHGTWVTIADRKAVEEDTMAHLASGQVLFEGRWINFPELKASRLRGVERPPFFSGGRFPRPKKSAVETPAVPAPAPAAGNAAAHPGITIIVQSPQPAAAAPQTAGAAPDTSLIIMSPPDQEKKTPRAQKEHPHAPVKEPMAPETSFIIMPPEPVKETKSAQEPPPPPTPAPLPDGALETAIMVEMPTHDKESDHDDYAPETKIIVFKPPEQSVPGASDTKIMTKPGDTQIVQITKEARPEEETPERKNRLVIVIGTMVVVVTLAAIVIIVLQMVR
jgi:hypothetical protein